MSSEYELQVRKGSQYPSYQNAGEGSLATTTTKRNHLVLVEEEVAMPVVTTQNRPKGKNLVSPVVVPQFRHPPPFP